MSEVSRAVAVLASCVVHAGLAIAMPQGRRSNDRSAMEPVWLELRVASAPAPVASLERESPPPQAHEAPRRSRAAPSRPERVADVPAAVAGGTLDADPAPLQAPRAPIDLSPLAAAHTLDDVTTSLLPDAGAPRERTPSHAERADALAQQVPGLRASQGPRRAVVADAAEDALYNVLRPWKLLSKPERDGAYRYTGAGFDATILPDGRVRFREKDGLVLTLTVIQSREFGVGSQLPPTTTVGPGLGELRALWQRLRGKDPHAAERRSFLARTRALREHLADRAGSADSPPERTEIEPEEPALEPR